MQVIPGPPGFVEQPRPPKALFRAVSAPGRPRRVCSTSPKAGGSVAEGGGAVVVLPGFLSSSRPYAGLLRDLRSRGFHAEVVPMSVLDWMPVLSGSSFEWYLERLDAVVCDMHARHGRVALVGHSAGGWIARILLGSEPYQGVRYGRSSWVHTLLTLGTPHQSIENYPFGRAEETLIGPHVEVAPVGVQGSSLQYANYFYPTADSLGGVRVVCACGDAIRGQPLWGDGSSSGNSYGSRNGSGSSDSYDDSSRSLDRTASSSISSTSRSGGLSGRLEAYFAYEGYKSGCGRGDVDGDGVTPLCIAFLPGAEQLTLPGVWHMARGKLGQLWYGDAPVVDRWQHYLLADAVSPQSSGMLR